MIKNILCGLMILGCVSVDCWGMNDDYKMGRIAPHEKHVKFVNFQKPVKCFFDQERLEEEDLKEDDVEINKKQGLKLLKRNSEDACCKLIKAFFGNSYLEEEYYKLQLKNVSKDDVRKFFDNIYVGDKRVVTYIIKLLPDSVFWKEMRQLVYVPCGHY
jgi:hypothetical protein